MRHMTYVKKGDNFLLGYSMNELEKMYRKEKNLKAKLRLLCAIHRKKGKTILEIAETVKLPKSTVADYLVRLSSKGISMLYDMKNKGAMPKLNQQQQERLLSILSNEPSKVNFPFIFWSTHLVRYYIKREFNKSFTPHGIRKFLYRLGFTRQKPRQMHYKGNKEEQERFKKNFAELLGSTLKLDMKSSFWTRHLLF